MKHASFLLKLLTIIGLCAVVGLAQASKNLSGKHWVLTAGSDEKIVGSNFFIELDVRQNRISGSGGCNQILGKTKISKEKLNFSGIVVTAMMCQQGKTMLTEQNFLRLLKQTTRFQTSGEMLTLYAGNKKILQFTSTKPNISKAAEDSVKNMNEKNNSVAAKNLLNKKWIFAGETGAEAIAYIVFDEDEKTANGDSGCNGFGADFHVDGEKISVTETMSTDRACVEAERRNISQKFMEGLGNANRFEIVGENLNLYRNGELLLILKNEAN